jgi:hypothetical protein
MNDGNEGDGGSSKLSVEAKGSEYFVQGVGQALAQTLDILLDGAADSTAVIDPQENAALRLNENMGVLTTGQLYFFFNVKVPSYNTEARLLEPLALYSLHYYPPRRGRTSNMSVDNESVNFEEFLIIVCAIIVSVTKGRNNDERVEMMEKGSKANMKLMLPSVVDPPALSSPKTKDK